MMVNKVLVVEDDLGIQEFLKELLLDNGFAAEVASDGVAALSLIKKSQPDLVLLDLGLPNLAGEAVCLEIKKKYPDLPIIILTAKDDVGDVVKGLNLGADDYITKPFIADELIARIKARLRHSDEVKLQIGDLELNNKTFEVKRAGKLIQLSPHEFKLLQYLISNKGRVLTREMILNRVWLYSYEVDTRVVDVYIGYLRKKIDADFKKKLIHSVRGFGYMIKE
ncbi:MAG TPA: response regulator transcription factor [Candidatus Saccharimonadales bacterium]|nr:response regulator transcription factor [Candidatus Saccharimonadales bacterium]